MYVHNKWIVPNYWFECKYIVVKVTWYKVGLRYLKKKQIEKNRIQHETNKTKPNKHKFLQLALVPSSVWTYETFDLLTHIFEMQK